MSAFSNDSEVTFGVTTGGRPSELDDIESSVGMYLNTLPFRIDLSQSSSVDKWLGQVQEQQLSADEHGHVGLASAIAGTDLAGSSSPFDLIWIYENFPRSDSQHSLELDVRSVFEQTNYPMTVMAGPQAEGFALRALFDGHLLDDNVAVSFLEYLANAARSLIAADPEAEITEIDPATDSNRLALLASGQGRALPLVETPIHHLFDVQAKRTPDAVALVGASGSGSANQISYEELRTASNWLAGHLSQRGVKAGAAVGVEMSRSPNTIVALLAIAKAGAAYVPLDPSHPDVRRSGIKRDAGVKTVLTDQDLADLGHVDNPPDIAVSGADPLLITFTSGSTGTPKGVPVHHAGVLNRLQWQWTEFGADSSEVMAHKTSFTFVDHLFEVWGGLLAGRTVVVIDEELSGSPHDLVAALRSHRVTQLSLVPSLLGVLVENENLGAELPDLTLWTVSGEPTSVDLAQRFYDVAPRAMLLNLYGMSEASQDSTFYVVPNPVGESVPIGKAIANMTTYIVGPTGKLAPDGVVGELCLSGSGLSNGYLNQPDLTAHKFVPNPFGDGVLYKTGDLARRRADGNLELAGRVDRQMKIRGVRVEPDGVEAALRRLPGISQAAVVGIDSALVAYVVGPPSDTESNSALSIRAQLSESLPTPMVPSTIHVIDEMPTTASGKLDRQALLNLPSQNLAIEPSAKPSELSSELQAMLDLWSDLLGVQVGPDDDFFALGGHSLAGLRLFSRIKRDLGYSLSLAQLASASTPRSLLEAATTSPADTQWRHLLPMASLGESNLFCLHGAGGNVLNLRELASALSPKRRLIAVKAAGADSDNACVAETLPDSIDSLIEPYVNEIDAFQPTGALLIAGFSNGGLAAYEVAQRLIERGRVVSGVILLDTIHPAAKAQAYGMERHIADLKRDPVGTLKAKAVGYLGRAQIAAIDRFEWAAERWQAEATEATLIRNNVDLWADYEPGPIDAQVVLLSAEEIHPMWLHLGESKGWPRSLEVRIVVVPGNHKSHIMAGNAGPAAAAIHAQLDV